MKVGQLAIYTRKKGDHELVKIRFINPKDTHSVEVFFPSTQESWWVATERLELIKES